jgi:ElaA protein
MKIAVKTFPELSIQELYDVLQLRSEVFVVEQNCVYQDIDGKDQKAVHVLGVKEGTLVAYTRIFKAGDYFKEAAIGRVVVKMTGRKLGYGHEIMKASVAAIYNNYKTKHIRLSAQTYLIDFYNKHGFVAEGDTYLEDGIPHINMVFKG